MRPKTSCGALPERQNPEVVLLSWRSYSAWKASFDKFIPKLVAFRPGLILAVGGTVGLP